MAIQERSTMRFDDMFKDIWWRRMVRTLSIQKDSMLSPSKAFGKGSI